MVNLPVNDNALALCLRAYDIEAGSVKPHPQERLPPRYDFAVELDRVRPPRSFDELPPRRVRRRGVCVSVDKALIHGAVKENAVALFLYAS